MGLFCGPAMHTHPPMRRACEGCHRLVCGPDDQLHTSSGVVAICPSCWDRWRAGGYARVVRLSETRPEPVASRLDSRFWSKVDKTDGCWLWTASTNQGYGQFWVEPGRLRRAHRLAYEDARGPVPAGMELDHLCRIRSCVNPQHLEPVTHRENLLRGDTVPARRAARTHCPQGHEYSPANVSLSPRGQRDCISCSRVANPMTKAQAGSLGGSEASRRRTAERVAAVARSTAARA